MKNKKACRSGLIILSVMLTGVLSLMNHRALANTITTTNFEAASSEELVRAGDEIVAAKNPSGEYSIDIKLLDGWLFEDKTTERTVKSGPGEYTIYRIHRGREERAKVIIKDGPEKEEDCHLYTAEIEAANAPAHQIFMYPIPMTGVKVDITGKDVVWDVTRRAKHVLNDKIGPDPNSLKTIVDMPKPNEDGLYPKGSYSVGYSTDWKWEKCIEKKCISGAMTNSTFDVYELSLEPNPGIENRGFYLGLDMTDDGKKKDPVLTLKANIDGNYEWNTTYDWKVAGVCRAEGATDEPTFTVGLPKGNDGKTLKREPSKKYQAETLSCHATISGCHEGCFAETTAVTNFTVVRVDVTIDMTDCVHDSQLTEDEALGYAWTASEEIEESQGAFIHYEDDHKLKPFSPRGTNMLTRVRFSIRPKDLPKDEKVTLTFPEEALWEKGMKMGRTTYTAAKKEYSIAELEEKTFCLHGHTRSEMICDQEITITHTKSGATDKAKYTVVELDLVPDFNRDHVIDEKDEMKVVMQKKFYWWLNDDADDGDCANCFKDHGTELPGNPNGNFTDSEINGHTDLLDFFPMWLNEKQALDLVKDRKEIVIRFHARGVGYAMTRLECTEAGDFLTKDSAAVRESLTSLKDRLDGATVHRGENIEMPEYFTRQYKEGGRKKGILIMEGGEAKVDKAKVQISLVKKTQSGEVELLTVPFQCSFRNVLEMMDRYDITESTPEENPCTIKDKEYQKGKYRIFSLHGFKVSKTLAQGWHAEFFKRLYQSGSTARFTGITWPGIIASDHPGLHYHRCAYNALNQAERLAAYIKAKATKETAVVMAHSLGNMLVSEAIQEYDLQVSSYFMLNGAIASEAFDPSRFNASPANKMLVPWDWDEYPVESYSAYWHKLYEDDANPAAQSRAQVKWIGKFSKVLDKNACANFVNCMSSGDEVFDFTKDVCNLNGLKIGCYFESMSLDDLDLSQYCWQKQEVGKGVICNGNFLEDSDEGGWGYNTTDKKSSHTSQHFTDARMYNGARLEALVKRNGYREMLRAMPAFNPSPQEVFCWNTTNPESNRVISRNVRNHLLACAIPAISTAMGKTKGFENGVKTMDMDEKRGSGWGRGLLDAGYFSYGKRWLHCDVKDMAYFYTEPLWKSIVKSGNLKEEK